MTEEIQNRFSNKLVYLNYALAVLIVITHTYCVDYAGVGGIKEFNIINAFLTLFQGHICQVAVPTFFVISGFLFYQNFEWTKLKSKWKSRVRSLLIPYLLWNLLAYVFYGTISNLPFTQKFLSMEPVKFSLRGGYRGSYIT